MNKMFVIVGRTQGFHNGHLSIFKYTKNHFFNDGDKILVVTGSANKSRTLHDPFTVKERQEMIKAAIDDDDELSSLPIEYDSINDSDDDYDKWIKDLKKIVKEHGKNYEPVIVGHDDIRTYAHKAGFHSHIVPVKIQIHGTDIRRMLLRGKLENLPCPKAVIEWFKEHNVVKFIRSIAEKESLKNMVK